MKKFYMQDLIDYKIMDPDEREMIATNFEQALGVDGKVRAIYRRTKLVIQLFVDAVAKDPLLEAALGVLESYCCLKRRDEDVGLGWEGSAVYQRTCGQAVIYTN